MKKSVKDQIEQDVEKRSIKAGFQNQNIKNKGQKVIRNKNLDQIKAKYMYGGIGETPF